jgi:SAM-dependent methyltransferase
MSTNSVQSAVAAAYDRPMRLATRKQKTVGRHQWPSDKRVVLHVGCGDKEDGLLPDDFLTPEWYEVRLDIDPRTEPDIVADIVDMPVVESASVDAVWSSHNLEHVFAYQVPLALGEFRRVLRPGAVAHIQVPDVLVPVREVMRGKLEQVLYESPAGPVKPIDMLFGFGPAIANGKHHMAHRTAFTRDSLAWKLKAAKFADVQVVAKDKALWATARRPDDE